MPPVRQERLATRPKNFPQVRGVFERGVEVDVVARVERQQQLGAVARNERALGDAGVEKFAIAAREQRGQPPAQGAPDRPPGCDERVERGLPEERARARHGGIEQTRHREGLQVEDPVTDRDAGPRATRFAENAVRKVLNRKIAGGIRRDPRAQFGIVRIGLGAHGRGRIPPAWRSSTGSLKLQLP